MNKKLIASILVVAFFGMVFVPVKAATIEELQAQIAALLAQITALQGQLQGQQAGVCFNANLSQGMTNNDVKNLQIKLGISPTSGYFGPLTLAKVKSFQLEKGLPSTGFVGPLTRGALNALYCTPVTTTTVPPTTVTTIASGVEGSVTLNYAAIPANNVVIKKGVANQSAAAIEIKAQSSDMKINRLWLNFDQRLWLYADQIALFDGETSLASMALSALPEVTSGSWQVAFNNLNITVPVGTTKTLTVKIGRPMLTQNNGTVNIQATSSIRATDGAGFSETKTLAARALNLEAAAALAGELAASTSITTPLDRAIAGLSETAGVLTPVELTRFDLKATKSAIEVTQIVSTLAATSGTLANQVAAVELRDGATVLSSVTGATTVTFPSLKIAIAKDATKTLSIWAQMNPIGTPGAGYTSKGAGINANVTVDATFLATDESFTTVVPTGAVTGNKAYMYRHAPTIALVGAPTTDVTTVDGATNDIVQFSWTFDITAPSEKNLYINRAVADIVLAAGKSATDVDIVYLIEYSAGAELTAQGGTIVSTGLASVTEVVGAGGYTGTPYTGETFFKIAMGQTGRFTITVSGTNVTDSKQVRALINDIEWTVDSVEDGAATGAATMEAFTYGLGSKTATPFKVIN